MKRVVEFRDSDIDYSFVENGNTIFEISKTELQFDAKKFYQSFFANDKDFSEIELRLPVNMDKKAKHVFDTVNHLLTEICDRLREELNDDVNQNNDLEESTKSGVQEG